jgi:hypothetical protein
MPLPATVQAGAVLHHIEMPWLINLLKVMVQQIPEVLNLPLNGYKLSGTYQVFINTSAFSAGAYNVVLKTNNNVVIEKISVLR